MIDRKRVRVLESVARPGTTIKYIDQVVRYAPEDITFSYFAWHRGIFGRYDVFHVHWPEFLIRSRNRFVGLAKRMLFRLFLLRLRMTSTPVVRTQHNLEPHEAGDKGEPSLLAKLDRLTSARVFLDEATRPTNAIEDASSELTTVIPHGDYREELSRFPEAKTVPGRLLYFGRVEAYKSVPTLIGAFESAAASGDELRIVGKPTAGEREAIEAKARTWTRSDAPIVLRLEHVPDADMVAEMHAAEAVVLPYREMHNSGVMLVALSLGTPVIAPASPTNESISREVGSGWVIQYDGIFDASTLRECMKLARGSSRSAPNLTARDWRSVAGNYAALFRTVTAPPPTSTAMPIFVNAGGQRDNIGDSLLRRAYLNALRPLGSLHVYTGPDAGYNSGLGLQESDRAYYSPLRWLIGTALSAVRRPIVLSINTGEVVGTIQEQRKGRWQVPLAKLVRLRGGHVLVAGVSVRPETSPKHTSLRALSRIATTVTWRDSWTRSQFHRGEVQPDWAYALGREPEEWTPTANRDVLAIAMRGDREAPDERWFRAVRETAAATGTRIVVVVQVRRDVSRADELATRLGAKTLGWRENVDHASQEREIRNLYSRSIAVVSDRIHALIVGMTEGAIPLGFSTGTLDKVVRSLEPVTSAHQIVVHDTGAESASWATTIREQPDIGEELSAARERLSTVTKHFRELTRTAS